MINLYPAPQCNRNCKILVQYTIFMSVLFQRCSVIPNLKIGAVVTVSTKKLKMFNSSGQLTHDGYCQMQINCNSWFTQVESQSVTMANRPMDTNVLALDTNGILHWIQTGSCTGYKHSIWHFTIDMLRWPRGGVRK
jgi:hypothetical protein